MISWFENGRLWILLTMSTRATYRKTPAVALNIQTDSDSTLPSNMPTVIPMKARTELEWERNVASEICGN